jgi:hypothetical protein
MPFRSFVQEHVVVDLHLYRWDCGFAPISASVLTIGPINDHLSAQVSRWIGGAGVPR